jgi:hypothetical protein
MDMLDMGRRRARGSGSIIAVDSARDATLVQAFERSRLPQALVSLDGQISLANRAFCTLVSMDHGCDGHMIGDTSLAQFVPGILRALRSAHSDGKPTERRATVPRGDDAPLELVLWVSPLPIPGSELHLIVHVDDARR